MLDSCPSNLSPIRAKSERVRKEKVVNYSSTLHKMKLTLENPALVFVVFVVTKLCLHISCRPWHPRFHKDSQNSSGQKKKKVGFGSKKQWGNRCADFFG